MLIWCGNLILQKDLHHVYLILRNLLYLIAAQGGKVGGNGGNGSGLLINNESNNKDLLLTIIAENKTISAGQIASVLSMGTRTVERRIKELREEGRFIHHGSSRGGYWEILK